MQTPLVTIPAFCLFRALLFRCISVDSLCTSYLVVSFSLRRSSCSVCSKGLLLLSLAHADNK